jgi:vancomycin resistance protein YoaR
MSKGKTLDYLSEDPVIPSEAYSLITIIGPHMPQKCSVWGLKIRGTAGTKEEAIEKSKRLHKLDPDYDIYTVDTGKFFPLVVDPSANIQTEYANNELNNLLKSYNKSRQDANDEWHANKNKMLQEAAREGKEGVEKKAIISFVTIKTLEEKIKASQEEARKLEESLREYKEEFEKYTEEEREEARREFDENVSKNISL